MIPLTSSLSGQERDLIHTRNELKRLEFTYGGNWDYDRGSFDRSLDDRHTVWLRIPFDVTQGEMDAEAEDTEARIRLGQPIVFKHLYQEGLDDEARVSTFGGLVNQFQDPVNRDAPVEPHWVDEAKRLLEQAEQLL